VARRTPRLAYCEYVASDNSSVAVQQARWDLMRCVRRVFPSMLEQLAVDVLPAYKELAKSDFKIEAILWHSRLSPVKELPEDSSLRNALLRWAGKFHAEQDWFLDHMLRTLRGWHVASDWRSKLKCNPIGGVTSMVAWGEQFIFECEGWEMQKLTWAGYSRSVREQFEEQLSAYQIASRKQAESHGLVRAPHKYSPENLEWFVLYQFAGLSSKKIADRADLFSDESTILKGVRTAARLIGWDSVRKTARALNRKNR
jgi:hypothetical protein